MKIADIHEVELILATYRPAVKEFLGKDMTLQRMKPLMDRLDNPQDKLRVIHIAGTSGKTSTTYYLARMLQLTGNKVGLTVSPHVETVLERIQINGQNIDEREFCDSFAEFMERIADVKPRPSYFELLVAFAYYYFAQAQVDYAIIETGLGGLHDGTNVAQAADKLCVITDIGYDHMKVLGDTLPEIAAQKAGIVHEGNYAVMFRQAPEIMKVIRDRCHDIGAQLQEVRPALIDEFVFDRGMPLYQRRNWSLAWSAYQRLANVYDLPVLAGELIEQSRDVTIPGRMQVVPHDGQSIILDGAHNAQKMSAFVTSFQELYPGVKPAILLSVRDRKDFTDLIAQLLPVANQLILTSFRVSQDIEHRSAQLADIQQFCTDSGYDSVTVEPDPRAAFDKLIAAPGKVKVVTGSFYLIQQIRSMWVL